MGKSRKVAKREQIEGEDGDCRRLPEEIVEIVLANLPVRDLLTSQAVCTTWSRFNLVQPSFLQMRVKMGVELTDWFFPLCFGREHGAISGRESKLGWGVHHASKAWQIVLPSMSFLPNGVKSTVLTAAGGLVLCRLGIDPKTQQLYVCNPVTRSWKQLPDRVVDGRGRATTMYVDHLSGTYKFFVFGGCFLQVYNSATQTWMLCRFPAKLRAPHNSVVCNGIFYFLQELSHGRRDVITMNAFDMEKGELKFIFLQSFFTSYCKDMSKPRLVACKDTLYLIGVSWAGLQPDFSELIVDFRITRIQLHGGGYRSFPVTQLSHHVGKTDIVAREAFEDNWQCAARDECIWVTCGDCLLWYNVTNDTKGEQRINLHNIGVSDPSHCLKLRYLLNANFAPSLTAAP